MDQRSISPRLQRLVLSFRVVLSLCTSSRSSYRIYRLSLVITSLSQSQRPSLQTNHFQNILSSSLFVPHNQLQLTYHSFISHHKRERNQSRSNPILFRSISPTSFHLFHTCSTSRFHKITDIVASLVVSCSFAWLSA